MRSSAPNTGLAVFSRLRLNLSAKTVSRYCNSVVSDPLRTKQSSSLYLEGLFGVICVHVPTIDTIVELLELEQILMCRAECTHFTVLANVPEEHHGSPFIACLNSCPPILKVFECAKPDIVLAKHSVGLDNANAPLPFPLPAYARDVVLGSICISRGSRARLIALLDLDLTVLWHELGLRGSLLKLASSGDGLLKRLESVAGTGLL